ncbi:MAG: nicotinate-nucleotide--dimethylbenzimidazole phosphoribosyltransferase [Acidimicrobiales bacterium]
MKSRSFARAAQQVSAVDRVAESAAEERQLRLTKPAGSLGDLELIGNRLASISGRCPPQIPRQAVVCLFAADHGVVASGVTPWPQSVTAAMVENIALGGAGINAIADTVGAEILLVDIGVVGDLSSLDAVHHAKVSDGTKNLAVEAAMSASDATAALDVGVGVADAAIDGGADLVVTGEMGIGNTTASAALIAALAPASPREVTGRGSGIDDDHYVRKADIVAAAVDRCRGFSPEQVLAEVGGLEIAALAGLIVGAASRRVPVLVDGVICCAALLVAERLVPGVVDYCFAGHRAVEPGAHVVHEELSLRPVLDLNLRLGEGSGACLAVPVVQCAAAALGEMATFDEAGIG